MLHSPFLHLTLFISIQKSAQPRNRKEVSEGILAFALHARQYSKIPFSIKYLLPDRAPWSYPFFAHFHPLAEVRLLKPGIQRRWLAKDALLPRRFTSRFFNRFPVALPLRCFHLEESSSVTAELARAERSEGIAEGEA